jgi:hypothetical protein
MKRGRASRAFTAGAVLTALVAADLPARADPPATAIAVHTGSHPGFGRLVIDTTPSAIFALQQDGDHVVLRLPDPLVLGTPPALPNNLLAIITDGPTLDLVLRHGAEVRSWRTRGHIVLDIMDEAGPPPATRSSPLPAPSQPPAARPPPSQPRPPSPMAVSQESGGRLAATAPMRLPTAEAIVAATPIPLPSAPAPAPSAGAPPAVMPPPTAPAVVEAARQVPPGRDVLPESEGPLALRARRTRLPREMDGTALLLPFDSTAAAASFRSGDSTYVVFDQRRPIDMAVMSGDPVFGAASVRLLPTGTVLRIPHQAGLSIALTQLPQGWRIAALTATPKQLSITVSTVDGHLDLAAEQPGDVVAMADPDTGATLLVGTQHRPGQSVAPNRSSMEFILRRTSQGVVVEPLFDGIVLKQIATGFTLSGAPGGLWLSPATSTTAALADAANLTRRLTLSVMPADALLRLSVKQIGEAAAAPPLARGPRHHAAAESLLALGLAAEAQSLLRMATERDPKEAASPDTRMLAGVAALLAGRPDEAGLLSDPQLDGTDEIALWRAVRQAMQDENSPAAAAVFAATAPLAFQYSAPIRKRILPLMVETMIQGGEIEPAARLLEQRKDDPGLEYARALLQQAEGDTARALAMLDAIAAGHDQFDRARAAIRAVELRLASGALDNAQAADALDKLLYAWRGDDRELKLRERVADLRGQTGAWRTALSMLRQAEVDFPDQAASVHQRLQAMFAGMIGDPATQQVPPIEFVSAIGENTDLVLESGIGETVEQALADRLLALDLPGRAKPVLEKLMQQAKAPVPKARFGTSLAMLDTREGNDGAALAALHDSKAADLPPDMAEQRLILRAGAVARQGDPQAGAALLTTLHTARATEERAQILESASDWPGAAQAWSELAALTLPPGGTLDETHTRILLHLATVTARASDEAGLAALREKYGTRLGAGPLADMFRLLTSEPIRNTTDIGRSQREVSLAASLPTDLKALKANAGTR